LRIPIHPDGWPFIAIALVFNFVFFMLSPWAGGLFAPLTIWCIAFFRDPERTTPEGKDLVISPADGRLLPITHAVPPREVETSAEPRLRLSIFMDIFDVHVNRVPIDGRVTALSYREGRFFNASFDKASEHNERMSIRIEPEEKGDAEGLTVIQIAGLVARRIKCDLAQGQQVRRGERFGIIRFGSRLDIYLPPGATVLAGENQRVRAGETILAKLK